jgi:hypothetical protein
MGILEGIGEVVTNIGTMSDLYGDERASTRLGS